jgi:hypothetical protein
LLRNSRRLPPVAAVGAVTKDRALDCGDQVHRSKGVRDCGARSALPRPAVLGRRAHEEEREELESSVVPAGKAGKTIKDVGREMGGGGLVLQGAELGGGLLEGGLEAPAEEVDDGGGEGWRDGPGLGAGAGGAGGDDEGVVLEEAKALADGAFAEGKALFDVGEF